jgi:hypothetical protein
LARRLPDFVHHFLLNLPDILHRSLLINLFYGCAIFHSLFLYCKQDDVALLGVLGPLAAEIDRMAEEWAARLRYCENGSMTQRTSASTPRTTLGVFAGKRIFGVKVLGRSAPVSSYKEALLVVAKHLQATHPEFDSVVPRVRGRFPYFSERKSDLRMGEKLDNSKFFIETHNSADRQWAICADLVRAFGYDPSDPSVLHFEVESSRTRKLKDRSV